MKLEFIPLDKLIVSKTNMRFAKRPPDVSDLLPSVRQRGVLQPVIVRPAAANDDDGVFEIIAGARRFTAASIIAGERRAEGGEADPLPCAILETSDDAAAVEASLIENIARLDADEVTQWVTFTRLIREGRSPDDIAATFGLPALAIKRVLALGNLLPRIRTLYADDRIDRATIRHLTLASKRQQQDWLRLVDDPDAHAPMGAHLKAWLFGGQSIPTKWALFDVEASGLATIADLFGEDRYFADASAFWTAQEAAIMARREACIDAGWGDVVVLDQNEYFYAWDYEKTPKKKGGRVYVEVRASGEVTFHEGYVSRREAERAARGSAGGTGDKPKRPELTSALQVYVDLHRHAALRAALTDQPGVTLRLMVAHVVTGSPLWTVRPEPQAARDEGTLASLAVSAGEARFGERRAAVLALLGLPATRDRVVRGHGDEYDLVRLFARLLELPDAALGDVIAVAMGETLQAGSAAVEATGLTLGVDMADWWQADPAFFDLLRDKQILSAIVAEVAGESVAAANAKEKGATLKRIITDHLTGSEGRSKVEQWVPGWMAFPPAAYTDRGGVGTVSANALVTAARSDARAAEEETETAAAIGGTGDPDDGPETAQCGVASGTDDGMIDAAEPSDTDRLAA